MNRFARERHEYRALVWSGDDPHKLTVAKGPWRTKRAQAHADLLDLPHYPNAVVQKVRLGITKILETEKIR